jgi:hypothetical protein
VKALLAKFMPYKGLGLYVGEDEVFVSKVVSTPLGLVELARHSQKYAADQLDDVVAQLLKPLVDPKKRGVPVAVGVPTRRVFFSTRPLSASGAANSAQTVLREMLQSPNVCIDELSVQVVKGEFGKRKLASVVSCRREYLFDLLQTLRESNVQPFRTEPAPFALLRVAITKRRVRRSKPALRLFLGQREALAVVTAGTMCVLWKPFKLVSGNELPALCSAIRSCQTLVSHFGIDAPLDIVVVHGRADLRGELTRDEFAQKVGATVSWCEGPELTGEAVAYGLAVGCLGEQSSEVVDLSQSLTPSPSLWQIFPLGECAVQVALVLCMALFMLGRSHHARKEVAPLRAELAKRSWAVPKQQADLLKEQRDLTQKVDAIQKFVGSRVLWTRYTYDIAGRLPENATLTMFQGVCELDDPTKGKTKKSFSVRAEAPIGDDGATPKEIDGFLTALRGHPMLQQDFPLVELADIKCTQPNTKDKKPTAMFTVVCLPKATTGGPAAPKPAGKEAHK